MFIKVNERTRLKVPAGMAMMAGLLFAFASGTFGQQVPCRVFIPEELRTPEIVDLLEQTSGILDSLATRREKFLATGNMLEIFPALYYHTTRAQIEEISKLDKDSAIELLGLVIDFYAAYEDNRRRFDNGGPKKVEPHWKTYYERAVERNRAKSVSSMEVLAVLLYGVDAHLTDLPRSLRRSFIGKVAVKKELETAYRNLDRAFYRAGEAANNDMVLGRKIGGRLMEFEKQFDLGARYVIHLRDKAWSEAIGNAPLRATGTHPSIVSLPRSTNHFTFDQKAACPASK